MNILHFLSDLFYDVSYFAAMTFGQAACCLASLNPLQTVLYMYMQEQERHRVTEPAALKSPGSKMAQNCLMLPAITRDGAPDVGESGNPHASVRVSHR